MEIKLHDGRSEIMLRGNDGTYELCWPKKIKDKEAGRVIETFKARRWYSSLPNVFDALLRLKISHSNVRTLEELQKEIVAIRKELLVIYD